MIVRILHASVARIHGVLVEAHLPTRHSPAVESTLCVFVVFGGAFILHKKVVVVTAS